MDARVALVADRFVVRDRREIVHDRAEPREALDLSTGERVALVVSTSGGETEQARWAARCGRFAVLHHARIARLIDYGPLGDTRRFEAWRVDRSWSAARRDDGRALARAREFLDANRLTAGVLTREAIHTVHRRTVVLPDASAGYDAAIQGGVPERMSREALGLVTIARNALVSLAEVFADSLGQTLRVFSLWGVRGSGLSAALSDLARVARLHGHVPVCVRALTPQIVPLLRGRSVFLIVRTDPADGWRTLVELVLHSSRPHVVVFAVDREVRRTHPIPLARLSVEDLCGSVLPPDLPKLQRESITVAARRARGLPGRFAALLWGRHAMNEPVDRPGLSRAAEDAVFYGHESSGSPAVSETPGSGTWPAPGELVLLRRRLNAGLEQLAAGRHAMGDRTLRQLASSFARRRDWQSAADAAIALAASLLKRGRTGEAQTLLNDARRAASAGRQGAALVQIAVLSGSAAIDENRLDDAEAILSAAAASAGGLGESAEAPALALARCLFWRGAYDAAEKALASVERDGLADAAAVRLAAERSRVAVGRGDLKEALTEAATARSRAEHAACSASIGAARCAAAFAHLAVGDRAAVDADVAACLQASRRAHDPLLGLRASLIAAEAGRRQGGRGPASALTRRIRRMGTRRLPPIVRARVDLLADLLAERAGSDVVARHARATGLRALALFAPAPSGLSTIGATVGDIVEILQCCQAADEDAAVLTSLCASLRAKLQAAAVGFFVEDHGAWVPVASDGGRLDSALAARVSALDQPTIPHAAQARLDGGVPVRYGGRLTGALVIRWTPATPCDFREAAVLLTTAAAAAAPALAAIAARRRLPIAAVSLDLIGTSRNIAEVRRAVERAAPAPFAVLVEGESGSGKELVARALHRRGPRRDRPFCTLNCAALPDDLVESELFGHSRGAFTGAVAERPGVFEEAHTGTLFLDGIGELSCRAQAKVLRTIQEGELRRVGENLPRRVDVRLVAATNRDLRQEAAAGRFRVDLLYRLDVIRIAVPPLRERRDDIALLADHFWREATARVGSRATLATATLAALARYDWPGNVREVQNVLAALAVRSPRRGVVPPSALPPCFDGAEIARSWRLDQARRTFEMQFIRTALARSGGHRTRAAEDLGLTRQGLTKLMARLGIHDEPSMIAPRDDE